MQYPSSSSTGPLAHADADYRPDIDGLRALAVAGVVLFHAGFDWIGGGFAGVDVFFVISGYLITSIIVREQRRGTFTLARFYERRARRILPALLVVLVPTSAAAWLWLEPRALQDYAASLLAVLTFSSNLLFIGQAGGYFAPAAEQTPLIHTWSLAVEEQFYILFPLAMLACWRFGARRLAWGIGAVALASLVGSEWLRKVEPHWNFYLVFTRAWELLAGALLALPLLQRPPHERFGRVANEALAGAGVVLIVGSFVVYDAGTQFPSLWAVPPVAGVLLVIAFGAGTRGVFALLSAPPLVGLGLISYSAYLWHQPVFAFARVLAPHAPSATQFAALIALTVVLAWATWRFVELPFRRPGAMPRRRLVTVLAAGSTVFFSAGVAAHLADGFPQRYARMQLALAESAQPSPHRRTCVASGDDFRAPQHGCRHFHDHVTWAALGDSHVIEPAYALAERLRDAGQGVLHLSFAGCPPALTFEPRGAGCRAWLTQAVEYLESQPSIVNVLLAFRDTRNLFGEPNEHYPELPDDPPYMRTELAPAAAREAYWKSYAALIDRLLGAGKRVHVMLPVPELPKPVGHYIFRERDAQAPVTSLDYYARRHAFILRKLATLPWGERLVAVDPRAALCAADGCRAVIDGAAMYYDDDHLSVAGAARVLDVALEEDG